VQSKLEPFQFDEAPIKSTHSMKDGINVRVGTYYGFWYFGTLTQRDEPSNDKDYKGVLLFNNGDAYIGHFLAGKKSGRGRFISSNQSVYEGEFALGRYNGEGTLTKSTGEILRGRWLNGSLNGPGEELVKGTKYVGEFRYGLKHGKGTLTK
jgi:hypothetical protein